MSGNLNRSSSYGHTVISTGWRVLAMPIIQASSACYDRMRSQNEDRIRTRFSCVRSQKGELILEFPREKSRNGDLIPAILEIRSRIWDRIIVSDLSTKSQKKHVDISAKGERHSSNHRRQGIEVFKPIHACVSYIRTRHIRVCILYKNTSHTSVYLI